MRLLLTLVDEEEIEYQMTKDSVTIGRSSQCDLVIAHESMSRHHCKIEVKDGEIFITDLGSINGVYIDGKKIPPNSSVPFHTYLHLAFGYVTSAQLMVDEGTRLGVLIPTSGLAAGSPSVVSSNSTSPGRTKTKTVQTSKADSSKPKQKPAKDSGKNALLINLLAFVGILGALYYFLYAGKEPISTTVPGATPTAPVKPVDTNDHF